MKYALNIPAFLSDTAEQAWTKGNLTWEYLYGETYVFNSDADRDQAKGLLVVALTDSIQSLEVDEVGNELNYVTTAVEFRVLVQEMGWNGVGDFENDTGVSMDELLGKRWQVQMGRVFIEG